MELPNLVFYCYDFFVKTSMEWFSSFCNLIMLNCLCIIYICNLMYNIFDGWPEGQPVALFCNHHFHPNVTGNSRGETGRCCVVLFLLYTATWYWFPWSLDTGLWVIPKNWNRRMWRVYIQALSWFDIAEHFHLVNVGYSQFGHKPEQW